MKYYYKDCQFFLEEVHGENIPDGAVEISEELWTELLSGQGGGKEIYTQKDGTPGLRDVVYDLDFMTGLELAWRDAEMRKVTEAILLDYDELSDEDLEELKLYRKTLKDYQNSENFPYGKRPNNPKESV